MLMMMMMMLMMLIRHRDNEPSSCSLFTMRMIGGLDYYVAVKQVRVGMMCMSAMMMMMYVGGDDVGVMM